MYSILFVETMQTIFLLYQNIVRISDNKIGLWEITVNSMKIDFEQKIYFSPILF